MAGSPNATDNLAEPVVLAKVHILQGSRQPAIWLSRGRPSPGRRYQLTPTRHPDVVVSRILAPCAGATGHEPVGVKQGLRALVFVVLSREDGNPTCPYSHS